MKLKTTALLTLATVLGGAGSVANAATLFDIYAGGTIGLGRETVFTGDDHLNHDAESYGAVIGIDIPLLRAELEYDYLNTTDSHMHVGMFNAYFKLPTVLLIPYFGAGIGTIFNGEMAGGVDIRGADAYQAMIGVTLDLPVLPIKLDAEARALYAPNFYEAPQDKPDLLHYDARLKLRYIF